MVQIDESEKVAHEYLRILALDTRHSRLYKNLEGADGLSNLYTRQGGTYSLPTTAGSISRAVELPLPRYVEAEDRFWKVRDRAAF